MDTTIQENTAERHELVREKLPAASRGGYDIPELELLPEGEEVPSVYHFGAELAPLIADIFGDSCFREGHAAANRFMRLFHENPRGFVATLSGRKVADDIALVRASEVGGRKYVSALTGKTTSGESYERSVPWTRRGIKDACHRLGRFYVNALTVLPSGLLDDQIVSVWREHGGGLKVTIGLASDDKEEINKSVKIAIEKSDAVLLARIYQTAP